MGSLSADQLVTKLKQIQGKLTDSERKAADKVVQNFVDLNVPVDSEILELCSKTGHVSASIQTRGFYKVDILNEDMPTLRKLEALQLYRWLHLFSSHYLSYKSTIFKNVMFRLQFRTLDFTGFCFHRNYIWRHLEGSGSTGLEEAS